MILTVVQHSRSRDREPTSRHPEQRYRSRSRSRSPNRASRRDRSRSRTNGDYRSREYDEDGYENNDNRNDNRNENRNDNRKSATRARDDRRRSQDMATNNKPESSQQDHRVYVGNLSYDVKWHHLKDYMRSGMRIVTSHVLYLTDTRHSWRGRLCGCASPSERHEQGLRVCKGLNFSDVTAH